MLIKLTLLKIKNIFLLFKNKTIIFYAFLCLFCLSIVFIELLYFQKISINFKPNQKIPPTINEQILELLRENYKLTLQIDSIMNGTQDKQMMMAKTR